MSPRWGGRSLSSVREVERYRLEIWSGSPPRIAWALEPSSLRGAGPSTTLELPRVSGVADWCGLAYSSPAQPPCVGVHSGEREGRFPARFGLGIGLLLLFVPTGPNSSTEYQAFLESLGGVLDSAPTGDSIVSTGGLQRSRGQQQ
ncbi:hypothetical protein L3Q82_005802 [Scortum barcoo]|uniref:Uncharacterized protein n=1 Tax=Scortum barcoo TaxID=214431 RepID=A0ACB8V6I5_9TELE|nr:hypothetical protein L3Q82_005802 [Scortum barcoo]